MSLFAHFDPEPTKRQQKYDPAKIHIRPANCEDRPELAAIRAEREGVHTRETLAYFEQVGASSESTLLIAEFDGDLVGYGKAHLFIPEADAPTNTAPSSPW